LSAARSAVYDTIEQWILAHIPELEELRKGGE
jgi:hypothetical protein